MTLITREHWERLTDKHPATSPRTWGAAYHVPPEHVKEVKEYLDIREINGYSMDMVEFHVPVLRPEVSKDALPSNSSTMDQKDEKAQDPKSSKQDAPAPIRCLLYIGLPNNPQFLGPQDPDVLAKHIITSVGPSGENKEYVYMLEEALDGVRKDTGVNEDVDEHIVDLARRVRREENALLQKGNT